MKYTVWGYGWETERLLKAGLLKVSDIAYFIDTNKTGKTSAGIDIISPSQALGRLSEVDKVLIPVRLDSVKRDIYAQAINLGYPNDRLLFLYNTCNFAKVHEQNDEDLEQIASGLSVERVKKEQKLALDLVRPFMPFVSLNFDDLKFIFGSGDQIITNAMIQDQAVFPKSEMEFCLSKCRELGLNMGGGVFLDIGANVGTTTVYMHKRLGETWKYYAFEPMEENFKLLKVNCLLNDCQGVVCENKGVTDASLGVRFLFDEYNSGGSGVDEEYRRKIPSMVKSRVVPCVAIDDYVQSKNITIEDIRLIWIDVQGHEPNVIAGAKKTFKLSSAPCYVEFNFQDYEELGTLLKFIRDLQEIYDKFICYEQYEKGQTAARPVAELGLLADELKSLVPFGNIFLWKDMK